MNHWHLPDNRAYPETAPKSDLLRHASVIASATSGKAARRLAEESLHTVLADMFEIRRTTALQVALSMAPNAEVYTVLQRAMADVLSASEADAMSDNVQFFALPLVVVAGVNDTAQLEACVPVEALNCFEPFSKHSITWLSHLVEADALAQIRPEMWFHAKKNPIAALEFLNRLPAQQLSVKPGSSLHVLFALGFGGRDVRNWLNHFAGNMLELMQLWLHALKLEGGALFVNPLSPAVPSLALANAAALQWQMALDMFVTDHLRTLRLKNETPAVLIATNDSAELLLFIGSNETPEASLNWFARPLFLQDQLDDLLQSIADLLRDCQVEVLDIVRETLNVRPGLTLNDVKQLPRYTVTLQAICTADWAVKANTKANNTTH